MFGLNIPPWNWFMKAVFKWPPLGALLVIFLELGLMRLLQWWWDGRAPHLNEYSLAHLIGDPLLGVMVVFMGRVAKRNGTNATRAYWLTWIGLSLATILGYLTYKWSQGLLGSAWYLLEPTIIYHHILLFLFLVPALGGTLVAVLMDGGWRSWEMKLSLVLVIIYLILVFWYDPTHPHPEFHPEPGSPGGQFLQWVRLRNHWQ